MISKWYRGHSAKYSALDNFGIIWLTDDIEYAQLYAENDGVVSAVYVDEDKLNPADWWADYSFDPYFPHDDSIEEYKQEGANCYYFMTDYDGYDFQCLALFDTEAVVKVEKETIKLNEKEREFIVSEVIKRLNETRNHDHQELISNILTEINEYLNDFGLSCSINTKYDFSGYYKDCVAVYQYRSVMNNGKMRIALNIPLMLSHDLDDYEMKEQIEISMWHEVGHGLVQWIKSLRRKDTQAKTGLFKGKIVKDLRYILNNEEDVVEEFGAYQSGYYTYATLDDFINDYIQILTQNNTLEEGRFGKALGALALGGALMFGGANQAYAQNQTTNNPKLDKEITKKEKSLVKFGYADNVNNIHVIIKSAKTHNLAKTMANNEFLNKILSKNNNAKIISTDFFDNPENGECVVVLYYTL